MVKITHIFFDLFGVLLGADQSTIIHFVASKIDSNYQEVKEILLGESFMKLERGEINFRDYFQHLQYALPNGDLLDYESFKQKWLYNQIDELPTVEYIERLAQNYELGIISNTTEAHINLLKSQFLFFEHFNYIISSEKARSRKPQTEIFNYALQVSGAIAGNSIFIDDMKNNILTAETFGFTTHHFKTFEEFESFIKDYK